MQSSAPAPGACHERIFPFTVSTWLSPPFASFVKVFADDAYKILPCSNVVSRSKVFPFTSNDLPFTEFDAIISVKFAVAPFTFKVVRTLFAVTVPLISALAPLNLPPLNNGEITVVVPLIVALDNIFENVPFAALNN